jgi:Exo-beta-D-glucosaminidase Ig-fold domain
LAPLLQPDAVVLVKLELRNPAGEVVSQNLYWLGEKGSSYRELGRLPVASLAVTAKSSRTGDNVHLQVELSNKGSVASLADKLTLLNETDGSRILPAYYSDNYVSLLPGESREIEIEYSADAGHDAAQLTLRGWNFPQETVAISSGTASSAAEEK